MALFLKKLFQSEALHRFPATGTGHWPLSMMDLSPNKRGCRSVRLSSSFSISFISFQYQRFSWEAELLDFHESYSRTSCRSPGIRQYDLLKDFQFHLKDFHLHFPESYFRTSYRSPGIRQNDLLKDLHFHLKKFHFHESYSRTGCRSPGI